MPKLVAVQAAGCAPVVRALTGGKDVCDPWPDPNTMAAGLRVPKPFGDTLILRALRESQGAAIGISDADMRVAAVEFAEMEGIHACYEGAATLAALKAMLRGGRIRPEETIVLVNTGSGFLNAEPPRHVKVPTIATAADLIRRARRG